MKLNKLIIDKMYGSYRYEVLFNDDITFIYGMNGCGKTTVLNITEAIITGALYHLFEYEFSQIQLVYSENKSISINKSDQALEVLFDDKKYTIEEIRKENYTDLTRSNREQELKNMYFERYSVLSTIGETFNYVYLPLNRSSRHISRQEQLRTPFFRHYYNSKFKYDTNAVPASKIDPGLVTVETLVFDSIRVMNGKISLINDTFRNDILKHALDISNFSMHEFQTHIAEYNSKKIRKISKDYLQLLTNLDIMSEDESVNYREFFENIITQSESTEDNVIAELIFKYRDLIRIEKFTKIASKAEEQKEKVLRKKILFVNTINNFLKNTDDEKVIEISKEGVIGFKTNNSTRLISVHYLSSGERQLIIFFANLIFGVDDSKNGIFVVDEPELSLHLSWQKIFVEEARKINPNIQMIFATHSPEFIGKYRNKMFKLEKKYEAD